MSADQGNERAVAAFGGAGACRHGLAVLHRHTAFRKEFQRLGIEPVLNGEHTRGKCLGVVAGKHSGAPLRRSKAWISRQ